MSRKEPPIIETERLTLRPFTMNDAGDVFEYASDPEWGRYLVNIPQPSTSKEAEEFAERFSNLASWGKGLTPEAAHAVIKWAFQTYDLNKIYSTCDPRNERSLRVLEKLGMKQEGLLRSHINWQGEVRDVAYYGILRDEWEC